MKTTLLLGLAAMLVAASAAPAQTTISRFIAADLDDMERRVVTGVPELDLGSSDLELGKDNARPSTVGLRFTNITIPVGSTISEAYIQFTGDTQSDIDLDSIPADTDFVIRGQAESNALTFSDSDIDDMINRPKTTASVSWNDVPTWTENARGTNERTPDLSPIVAEVISLSGWAEGNAIAFFTEESAISERTAWSYERSASDGVPSSAPELVITFTAPTPSAAGSWALYE